MPYRVAVTAVSAVGRGLPFVASHVLPREELLFVVVFSLAIEKTAQLMSVNDITIEVKIIKLRIGEGRSLTLEISKLTEQ